MPSDHPLPYSSVFDFHNTVTLSPSYSALSPSCSASSPSSSSSPSSPSPPSSSDLYSFSPNPSVPSSSANSFSPSSRPSYSSVSSSTTPPRNSPSSPVTSSYSSPSSASPARFSSSESFPFIPVTNGNSAAYSYSQKTSTVTDSQSPSRVSRASPFVPHVELNSVLLLQSSPFSSMSD